MQPIDFTVSITWFRYKGKYCPWRVAFASVKDPKEVYDIVPCYDSLRGMTEKDLSYNVAIIGSEDFPYRRPGAVTRFVQKVDEIAAFIKDSFYPIVLQEYTDKLVYIASDELWTVNYLRYDAGLDNIIQLPDCDIETLPRCQGMALSL